jgi:hypothetical protein
LTLGIVAVLLALRTWAGVPEVLFGELIEIDHDKLLVDHGGGARTVYPVTADVEYYRGGMRCPPEMLKRGDRLILRFGRTPKGPQGLLTVEVEGPTNPSDPGPADGSPRAD